MYIKLSVLTPQSFDSKEGDEPTKREEGDIQIKVLLVFDQGKVQLPGK